MSAFDHLEIDGRLLQTLVAVVEEQSVTRAAERLGVTQSAVSHLLDKLRAIVGDPLVVRSGRGIVPTAQAEALTQRARALLEELRGFAHASAFEPARLTTTLTIAANELQRDLLLPALLRRLRAQAPGVTLRVVPSGAPTPQMLREQLIDLIVTPRPPDAADVMQKRLFEDRYRVFYDASQREAPRDRGDYLASEHIGVLHEPRRVLEIDRVLAEAGVMRRFIAWVPSFSGVAPFVRGTRALATLPGLLGRESLKELASADVPLPTPEMPMYMVWHLRHQVDAMHRWLRGELEAVAVEALAERLA